MIRAKKLTKAFGNLLAVNQLDLDVKKGEIFGLLGPDGAGKTTTMRLLTAIMDPTSGEGWVGDNSILTQGERIKDEIGYMSQKFGLYLDLTVIENLYFYAEIYGVSSKGRAEKIDSLLEFSNLKPFKDRRAAHLSGGMKQKLGLSCALVHTPKVLFLDEPTNGVDPISRRDFWNILYQLLQQNVTIFISTAYMDEAERCNRIALMNEGSVLACGTPSELKNSVRSKILDLQCDQMHHALDILYEKIGYVSIRPFGDHIYIISQDPDIKQYLHEILSEKNIKVFSIGAKAPTIEDVFIDLVTRKSA